MAEEVKLPVLSIVIPNLPAVDGEHIFFALQSAANQDYVNKNIIIVSAEDENIDNLIKVHLAEVILDRDDDKTKIYKTKLNNTQVAIVILKKSEASIEELRGVGIQAVSNVTHLYALLDWDSEYISNEILSKCVIKFLQFPQTVGMVYTDYMEDDVATDTIIHRINRHSNNVVISKLALEFSGLGTFGEIIEKMRQKFILYHLPEEGFVRRVNIAKPAKPETDFSKKFAEIQARIKQKSQ